MKRAKRFLAIILSMAMAMAMSSMAFAANGVPSEEDRATVKITNITGNPTVKLYQIISGNYGEGNARGLIKWTTTATDAKTGNTYAVDSTTVSSNGMIATIASGINNGSISANLVAETNEVTGAEWTASVPAGVYIAILTGANDGSVYNPILLSAYFNADSAITGGSVDSESDYSSLEAVAKKTTPSINKKITGGTVADTTHNNVKTVSVGSVVNYQIQPSPMPEYPDGAVNKTLVISDSMSSGLTFLWNTLEIKLGSSGNALTETLSGNEKDYYNGSTLVAIAVSTNASDTTDGGFTIFFKYDALVAANSGGSGAPAVPIIMYSAVVNENAEVGSAGNSNTATLTYSTSPTSGSSWDSPGQEAPTGGITSKSDPEVVYTYQLGFKKTDANDGNAVLKGAVFGIYSDEACEKLIDVVSTNGSSLAVSSKVGAGSYYVKELIAPTGYSLSETVTKIEANWVSANSTSVTTTTEYTSDSREAEIETQVGWLKGNVFYEMDEYTIDTAKSAGAVPAYVMATHTTTATKITGNQQGNGLSYLTSIPNTKLSSLPSTGGIGTTIFTIIGCLLMIAAAGLYFASRKKSSSDRAKNG